MQAIEENLDAARAEMEQVKTARDTLATQLQQVLIPGLYGTNMSRVLWWSLGGALVLSEVPLYPSKSRSKLATQLQQVPISTTLKHVFPTNHCKLCNFLKMSRVH